MSKATPEDLKIHMAKSVTQMAFLWRVQRTDGVVFGFTSHDRDLVVDGVTYFARSGFDASQITTSADLSVDNMQVSGMFSHDLITDQDMLNRVWDYAEVRLSRCQWSNLAAGVEKLRMGFLGEIGTSKYGFKTELNGLMQTLQQPIGRLYVAACDANLGDARCGIDIATYTVIGTVSESSETHVFKDAGRTEVGGWFTGGRVLWLTGANQGAAMEVKSFTASGGEFELQEGMRSLISVGDTYSVYAGCNKLRGGDCKLKFNNVINHRGFPVKPTQDQMNSGK